VVDFPRNAGKLGLKSLADERVVVIGQDAELMGDADPLEFAGAIDDIGADRVERASIFGSRDHEGRL